MKLYFVHPLTVQVNQDPDFFNKPHPDIHCLHCNGTFTDEPLVSIPIRHTDTKLGQSHSRESKYINHDTMHVHHLYCLNCARLIGIQHAPALFNQMLAQTYEFKIDFLKIELLEILPSLPFWTLEEFGGPLKRIQYEEWKKTGKITGIADYSKYINLGEVDKAWRKMFMLLKDKNKYYNFKFDPNDKFWFEPQPKDSKKKCWNCYGSLAGIKPVPCVLDYNEDTEVAEQCEGFFCFARCRYSYALRKDGQLAKVRAYWNTQVYSKYFENGRAIVEIKAPSRRLLKRFGGFLSDEMFRSPKNKFQRIREPPINDFPFFARSIKNMYYICDETHTWNCLNLMRTTTTTTSTIDNNNNSFQDQSQKKLDLPTTLAPKDCPAAFICHLLFVSEINQWSDQVFINNLENLTQFHPMYDDNQKQELHLEFIKFKSNTNYQLQLSMQYINMNLQASNNNNDNGKLKMYYEALKMTQNELEKAYSCKISNEQVVSKFIQGLYNPLKSYVARIYLSKNNNQNNNYYYTLEKIYKLTKRIEKSWIYSKMDGDEYGLGTKKFEKVFHQINNNTKSKLHFVLMTIEVELDDALSNEELLKVMINKLQIQKQKKIHNNDDEICLLEDEKENKETEEEEEEKGTTAKNALHGDSATDNNNNDYYDYLENDDIDDDDDDDQDDYVYVEDNPDGCNT